MDVFCVTDVFGDEVRLTEERWKHILEHHPIMARYLDHMKLTLRAANVVQRSMINPNEYRYYKLFEEIYGGKYVLVAVIKEVDNFVVTAFIVSTIRKGGEIVWLSR